MEGFFIASGTLQVVPAEEILLSRYHDVQYIMDLEFREGKEFLNYANEKEMERYTWDLYRAQYPFMTEDNYKTFSEFKDAFSGNATESVSGNAKIDLIKKEDLLEELTKINQAAKGAG